MSMKNRTEMGRKRGSDDVFFLRQFQDNALGIFSMLFGRSINFSIENSRKHTFIFGGNNVECVVNIQTLHGNDRRKSATVRFPE